MQLENAARYLMYPFMILPVSAAIVIWCSIVDDHQTLQMNQKLIMNDGISTGFAWFMLIFDIAFWFALYVYLD
jgi:hypothetical protein